MARASSIQLSSESVGVACCGRGHGGQSWPRSRVTMRSNVTATRDLNLNAAGTVTVAPGPALIPIGKFAGGESEKTLD